MKRTYPISDWRALEQFRSHLSNEPRAIQRKRPVNPLRGSYLSSA